MLTGKLEKGIYEFMTRWNLEKVLLFVKENSDCEFLSKNFTRSKDKYNFKCACGEIFEVSFQNFNLKNKRRCNKCSKVLSANRMRTSFTEVKEFVEENSRCKLLSDTYIKNDEPLEFLCECGEIFITTFDKFKGRNKRQCNKCGYRNIKDFFTYDYDFIKEFIESKSSCKLLSKEYIGCYEPLEILCECGEVFTTNFSCFKSRKNKKCKKCSNLFSEGEFKIKNFLQDKGVNFIEQFKFSDLKAQNKKHFLRFDFAVFHDNNLKFLIEYDGKQHFVPVDYFGGQEAFEVLQINDRKKENYCSENNIDLLRISYQDIDRIEEILSNYSTILW